MLFMWFLQMWRCRTSTLVYRDWANEGAPFLPAHLHLKKSPFSSSSSSSPKVVLWTTSEEHIWEELRLHPEIHYEFWRKPQQWQQWWPMSLQFTCRLFLHEWEGGGQRGWRQPPSTSPSPHSWRRQLWTNSGSQHSFSLPSLWKIRWWLSDNGKGSMLRLSLPPVCPGEVR